MNINPFFALALLFFGINTSSFGQTKEIMIKDHNNSDPLIGVNIVHQNTGYTTDIDGKFLLLLTDLPIELVITYVGYNTIKVTYKKETDIPTTIYMYELSTTLDAVTVTGSKYEQNINRTTVSLDIIKSDLLRSINAVGSSGVLNKIPGVQILDGQANIRGGSGYSYGAGSRVMLLIDDVPALQPDAGFPNWNDIPIENLSQIEVLKGAASTLYGSAALNGIINFRSSYAKSTPETRLSAATTVYLSPADVSKKWWGDTLRYESNFTFVHKQKFGKWDLIASGLYNKLEGFNQFTNESRGRGNINVRYRYSDALSFKLGAMINSGKSNSFFLWKDFESGAMQAFPGTVSDRTSTRIYIDPTITYTDQYKNTHKWMARSIIINNANNTNQSNSSINQYVEYQWQRNFENLNLTMTSGLVGSWNKTDSEILGDTTFYGQNHAAYLQMDKKLGDKLTIAGGLRYEYIKQISPEVFQGYTIPGGEVTDDKLIGRLSANYQTSKYSSVRASFGQGYRYPTLTERFVTTKFAEIFSIFANPALQRETGWSSEIAYKQGFSLAGFKGFVDVAGFISEYKNMVEFTFLGLPDFGFQPLNIGDTRISGIETAITGQFNIGKVPVNILGGYTYIHPIYKNFDTSPQIQSSISESKDGINILKYRSKHQFKMDVEAKIWKLKWGISCQYASHFVNIDRAFEEPFYILNLTIEQPDVFGIARFRDKNNKGYTLWDTRLSYEYKKVTITGLLNNVFNEEYSLRPALLEAPRNIALRIDLKLN
ncbi:MAG: TonB-dependent receptor [Saprospiraceae bacterium]|nr:TonB-dependent receptor [Saprospiraceae bacterium]